MNPQLQALHKRPANMISPRMRKGRNLGDLDRLAADIADRGLRHPVSVTQNGTLVIGARRLAACAAAGIDLIECRKLYSVPDALAVIRWENEDDLISGDAKYHLPATLAALAAQDMAMRELAWWPRAGISLDEEKRDRRDDLTGALLGPGETRFLNNNQYRQLHSLAAGADGWHPAQGGDGTGRLALPLAVRRSAREALALLEHRDARQVNAIHRRWKGAMPLTHPEMKPLAPADVAPFIAVITGFTGAIASTGIPRQDTTDAQVDEVDCALSDLIRALTAYRKPLRQAR